MKLVPVLDLRHGLVVHARAGDRANYRPLESRLCRGAEPLTVLAALLAFHPFRTLYVADLDAIEGRAPQTGLVAALRAAAPQVELWVDAGLRDAGDLERWDGERLGRPVLGSESLTDPALATRRADAILSLDYRAGRFLGRPELEQETGLWPDDLLLMELARVGGSEGPHLAGLRALLARAGGRHVHAAGGVRDAADLAALAALGVHGVLLASALHDGRLQPEHLAAYP